jgi:hypothetical protein
MHLQGPDCVSSIKLATELNKFFPFLKKLFSHQKPKTGFVKYDPNLIIFPVQIFNFWVKKIAACSSNKKVRLHFLVCEHFFSPCEQFFRNVFFFFFVMS